MEAEMENALKQYIEAEEPEVGKSSDGVVEAAVSAKQSNTIEAGLFPADPPNILGTFGKIAKNPFNVTNPLDTLKETTDKINDDISETGENIIGSFDSIFGKQDKSKKSKKKSKRNKNKEVLDNNDVKDIKNNILKDTDNDRENGFNSNFFKIDVLNTIENKTKEIVNIIPESLKLEDSNTINTENDINSATFFESLKNNIEEVTNKMQDSQKLKDALNGGNILPDIIKSQDKDSESDNNLIPDLLNLKDKVDEIKNGPKSTGFEFNIFEKIGNSAEEFANTFPDPLNLKETTEGFKNAFNGDNPAGNIFENIGNKVEEMTNKIPDPLNLKDKVDEFKNVINENNTPGKFIKNFENKVEEMTNKIPDPLNLKDKVDEFKNVINENNTPGKFIKNFENKVEEMTNKIPDPLNIKGKVDEFKNVINDNNTPEKFIKNFGNKVEEMTNKIPDPLKIKDTINNIHTTLKDNNPINVISNFGKNINIMDPLNLKDKLIGVGGVVTNLTGMVNNFTGVILNTLPDPLNLKGLFNGLALFKIFIIIQTYITTFLMKLMTLPYRIKQNVEEMKNLAQTIVQNNKKIIAALPDPLNLKGQLEDVNKVFKEKGMKAGFQAIVHNLQIIIAELKLFVKSPGKAAKIGAVILQLTNIKNMIQNQIGL